MSKHPSSTIGAHLLLLVCLALPACGGNDLAPTPSPAPASGLDDLATGLTITIDSLGSAVAVAALSDIQFDSTITDRAKVTGVRLDFGDGTVVAERRARHVYAAPGTYTARATFTLLAGGEVTVARQVVVKAVAGVWYHAAVNPASRRIEVRRLHLAQDGTSLRGVFSTPGEADRPVAGTLSGERTAQLSAGDERFEGQVPSQVSGAAVPWPLRALGGTTDGQLLSFTSVVDEPSTPSPVARFKLVLEPDAVVIRGLDVRLDASESTGDGLMYFLDPGDGRIETRPAFDHAFDVEAESVARLTIVDRFGRWDTTSQRFRVWSLRGSPPGGIIWWHSDPGGVGVTQTIVFDRGTGRTVTGSYGQSDGFRRRFSGTLSGSRDIRFAFEDGSVEFVGTVPLVWRCCSSAMQLEIRGGPADGQTLPFYFYYSES